MDCFDLGQDRGKLGRNLKRGNEFSGSIKCGKFWFHKEDFVQWI